VNDVQVTVNGQAADVDGSATVAALVAVRIGEHRRVAVAVNVEVLAPTAGG
jgi:thiamine biosynthesis protein ThiS